MKKYENPEIIISMFDANVATDGSALGKAVGGLNGTGETAQIDKTSWGSAQDWTVTF